MTSLWNVQIRYKDMRFACLFFLSLFSVFLVGFAPTFSHATEDGKTQTHATRKPQSESQADAQALIQTYFQRACQDPKLLLDRPSTGLAHREVPFFDSHGRSTVDLLKRVGGRAEETQITLDRDLQEIETCLAKGEPIKPAAPGPCDDVNTWYHQQLLPLVHEARFHLSLSQILTDPLLNPSQLKSYFKQGQHQANLDLKELGTRKEISWFAMVGQEAKASVDTLHDYEAQIDAKAIQEASQGTLSKNEVVDFKSHALYITQIHHGLTYLRILTSFPLLQYLKSPAPARDEVLKAIQIVHRNLERDAARRAAATLLAQQVFAPSRGRRDGVVQGEKRISVDQEALYLLEYRAELETELLAHPEDCGLAVSLLETRQNIALGNSLAIGGTLLAASVVLPFSASLGIGAISGAGFIIAAKNDRKLALEHFASQLEKTDPSDYESFDRADKNLKIAVGLGIVAPAVGPLARSGLKGLRAGAEIIKKSRAALARPLPKVPPDPK